MTPPPNPLSTGWTADLPARAGAVTGHQAVVLSATATTTSQPPPGPYAPVPPAVNFNSAGRGQHAAAGRHRACGWRPSPQIGQLPNHRAGHTPVQAGPSFCNLNTLWGTAPPNVHRSRRHLLHAPRELWPTGQFMITYSSQGLTASAGGAPRPRDHSAARLELARPCVDSRGPRRKTMTSTRIGGDVASMLKPAAIIRNAGLGPPWAVVCRGAGRQAPPRAGSVGAEAVLSTGGHQRQGRQTPPPPITIKMACTGDQPDRSPARPGRPWRFTNCFPPVSGSLSATPGNDSMIGVFFRGSSRRSSRADANEPYFYPATDSPPVAAYLAHPALRRDGQGLVQPDPGCPPVPGQPSSRSGT